MSSAYDTLTTTSANLEPLYLARFGCKTDSDLVAIPVNPFLLLSIDHVAIILETMTEKFNDTADHFFQKILLK